MSSVRFSVSPIFSQPQIPTYKNILQSVNFIPVQPITTQEFLRYFEGYLVFIRVITKFYLFIYLFHYITLNPLQCSAESWLGILVLFLLEQEEF